jgi:membrane-associated phospholipid phosphatase
MPYPPRPTSHVAWAASTLLLAPLLALCVRFLDVPLASFVKNHFYVNERWSQLTSDLPDLLLYLVLGCSCAALVLYRVRAGRGIYDALTSLARLVAWVAPASYLAKSAFKFVFGRVNTRFWLQEPSLYGFHWFQGRQGCEGFPSGHMVVVIALLAAFWRLYPKTRPYGLWLGAALGAALVATDYHFLSDVIAGAYLGLVVEATVFSLQLRAPLRPGNPAP